MLRGNLGAPLQVRAATDRDMDNVRTLLDACALPTTDLAASRPEFIVACADTAVVGVGGLERFGTAGLLRSVAVHPELRGTGLGHAIVTRLEQHARDAGLTELVLLTQTAERFFQATGYHVIGRETAPTAVQMSEEFRGLCPQSAVCMAKRLA
jgi:amino-acid N-acetyltransferase